MIIEDGELTNKTYSYITKEYDTKEENITSIPQQNYHLNMFNSGIHCLTTKEVNFKTWG